MTPETLFDLANTLALSGWLALMLSPVARRPLEAWGGVGVPLLLAVGYAIVVLTQWSGSAGGFDSLPAVEQLFQSRWLLLAGWVHYLAFDLLIGAWQLRCARREALPHMLLLPCLVTTFLFGPAGYLLFQGLRAARNGWGSAARQSLLQRLQSDSPRYTALTLFLLAAAIPVTGALLLDTRLFQGINVWIKPLKFFIAIILYLATLAVFARFTTQATREQRWWRWHERAVVTAVVLEMVWICGAAAQATASHFNQNNLPMMVIYGAMGLAAVLLTSATTSLAWAIHRQPSPSLSPALKTGLVLGLGLTLPLTLVTAGTLSALGSHWIGGTPSDAAGMAITGWSRDGGDLRVAHFFATHAMHGIPLAALVGSWFLGNRNSMPARVAAVLYVILVAGLFVQALQGQPFLGNQ